jgi:hypothetical protein
MKKEHDQSIKSFLLELTIYSILVVGYLFLVTHFLTHPIKTLFDHNKVYYAFIALLLIIFQGVVLETLTTLLLKLVGPKAK